MEALTQRKTYIGAFALIFMALGTVMQGFSDGTPIDWNIVIGQIMSGAAILGACKHGPETPPPK